MFIIIIIIIIIIVIIIAFGTYGAFIIISHPARLHCGSPTSPTPCTGSTIWLLMAVLAVGMQRANHYGTPQTRQAQRGGPLRQTYDG